MVLIETKEQTCPFSGVCVVVQVFGELWLACVVLCLCVVPIDYRRPQVIRCDKECDCCDKY